MPVCVCGGGWRVGGGGGTRALSIVSRDKVLRFKNTLLLIIINYSTDRTTVSVHFLVPGEL